MTTPAGAYRDSMTAWCPVCRKRVAIKPRVAFPRGQTSAWEVFDAHGCAHDGSKVLDRDHGFVTQDGRVVPEWEFDDPSGNASSQPTGASDGKGSSS